MTNTLKHIRSTPNVCRPSYRKMLFCTSRKALVSHWKLVCTHMWTNSFQICIPDREVSYLEIIRKWTQFPNSFQLVYTGQTHIAYPLYTNLILWKLFAHYLHFSLLIPCFLSPGENLASESGRLLLLILIILLF